MNLDQIQMTGTYAGLPYDVVFQVPFFNALAFVIIVWVMLKGFKIFGIWR